MELKDYQTHVITDLKRYLTTVENYYGKAERFYRFSLSEGEKEKEPQKSDYLSQAWDELANETYIPFLRDKAGKNIKPAYLTQTDGLQWQIPNVCLKVPTGGGKTVMACCAIETINRDYFKRETGFVLWVVPSDAIYKQTLKSLKDRSHPNRQFLDRASSGRVKVLEKLDSFNPQDVENNLCVMLLMLQASARKTKDQLRMFRDSGRFTDFFPDIDDYSANNQLLNQCPNLDTADLGDLEQAAEVIAGLSIRHSLGNTLRLLRPIIIIDEGHKAYSETARTTLSGFNPRFMLELSATPNHKKHLSNILCSVGGDALKKEQMIKLPIEFDNIKDGNWQLTIDKSLEKLNQLQKEAYNVREINGTYIRPIALIRVERTGKDQRDSGFIHAEDVREYLVQHCGINPDTVRVKSSDKDEIENENLLDPYSQVRIIITKDALKEGWDCPFAYVLCVLSNTTGGTALTQMIGRVLRQPYALATPIKALNQCYVFCRNQAVEDAVQHIKQGLENDGLGDLVNDIQSSSTDLQASDTKNYVRQRHTKTKETRYFLPKILHADKEGFRPLEYEQDILAFLDWESFSVKKAFDLEARDKLKSSHTLLDIVEKGQTFELEGTLINTDEVDVSDRKVDFVLMTRQLIAYVPNSWQSARIVMEVLESLRQQGASEAQIITHSVFITDEIRKDIKKQVEKASELLFKQKIKDEVIVFKLLPNESFNYELPQQLPKITLAKNEKLLRQDNNAELDKPLFEYYFQREFNGLEKDVALYLDDASLVKWWHRFATKNTDYALQGWRKEKVYPDFLVLSETTDSKRQFHFLETKGIHLKGNEDTAYKQSLMNLVTDYYQQSTDDKAEISELRFEIIMEDEWQDKLQLFNER